MKKVLVITSYRSGSGYCTEAINQLINGTFLNEVFSRAVPLDTYIFENNNFKLDFKKLDSKYDRLSVNYGIDELEKRIEFMLQCNNSWTAKIHADQALMIDKPILQEFLKNVTPVFLYRENSLERVISMYVAYKLNKYRYSDKDKDPDVEFYYTSDDIHIIEKIVSSHNDLRTLYSYTDWFKIYKYENFTKDPYVDFNDFNVYNNQVTRLPKIISKTKIKNLDFLVDDYNKVCYNLREQQFLRIGENCG